jgi:hypothetical protein
VDPGTNEKCHSRTNDQSPITYQLTGRRKIPAKPCLLGTTKPPAFAEMGAVSNAILAGAKDIWHDQSGEGSATGNTQDRCAWGSICAANSRLAKRGPTYGC